MYSGLREADQVQKGRVDAGNKQPPIHGRGQTTEDRRQSTDDRAQTAEDRTTDDRRQRFGWRNYAIFQACIVCTLVTSGIRPLSSAICPPSSVVRSS
jgi:hypothetical protein